MNVTQLAAVTLTAGSTAAQVEIIDLVPGYSQAVVTGVSADGSTLALNLSNRDGGGVDAFTRSNGVWHALARYGSDNRVIGMSADGRSTLTVSHAGEWLNQLVYERDGVRTLMPPNPDNFPTRGALSRDGLTAAFVIQGGVTNPHNMFFRWSAGDLAPLTVDFGSEYTVQSVLGSDRDDFFVFTGYGVTNPSNQNRVSIYDAGQLTHVSPLAGDFLSLQSNAVAVTTGDRRVIGHDVFRAGPSQDLSFRSWIHADGVTTELRADGVDDLYVLSASDDASLMVAQGMVGGLLDWFLLGSDGSVDAVTDLLAAEGVFLTDGQEASLSMISGDGTLLVGDIIDRVPGVSISYTTFTLRIPAPGPLGALALAGLAACRRRR
jgi:hypothetical protein